MELTSETKSNLELLDKILKYVKPSILLDIATAAEQIKDRYKSAVCWPRFVDVTFQDMNENLEKGINGYGKSAALYTIVGLMKVIEEIDKGK
jgi:ABC-type branched-subunit amino acid transport system ATPase component